MTDKFGAAVPKAGGTCGFSGDNSFASTAALSFPLGVAVDGNGNIFLLRIRTMVAFVGGMPPPSSLRLQAMVATPQERAMAVRRLVLAFVARQMWRWTPMAISLLPRAVPVRFAGWTRWERSPRSQAA